MIYLVYMYKEDLALNYLQWLICHKNKQNKTQKLSIHFFQPVTYHHIQYSMTECKLYLWSKLRNGKQTLLFYAAMEK